jgi:hypothetical protein
MSYDLELKRLQELSGINEKKIGNYGSNISITGNEKGKLMKKHNIKAGSKEWFKLWFSLPYMTGEKPI